jgi:RNA polymerase sigma-70 factor (ECF subfamily)
VPAHEMAVAGTSLVTGAEADSRDLERRLAESAPLVFRVAYSVLRHREDAEDVAQEALVRAHARMASLRDGGALRAWLVRMTWRLALDRRRGDRRRLRREQVSVAPAAAPSAEDVAAGAEARERLWRAVDRLPEKLRVVTVLAAIHGHDVREVAALLGLPEGTIKSRLHLARKRLVEELRWTVDASKKG